MDLVRYRPHLIATLSLGLPLVGGHLARMGINITDTVMMGQYGVEELAALVIATSVMFIFIMLGSGYGIGVLGLLATANARDDSTEVRRATRMALWLSGFHAILIMPVLWFAEPILLALGQTDMVADLSQQYLRIAGWGAGAALWAMVLNSYLAAMERTQVVLWLTVAGIPLNILLNWVFIFGNLGAPELGVRGAAIASIFTQYLTLLAILAYALWLPQARPIRLMQRFWKPDWLAFRAVFWLGLPVGMTLVAEVGMFVGTNIMMGWFGTRELAAHGIALQIASIAFMFHLGMSNAGTIRAGRARGLGDETMLREAAATVIALSVGFALLTGLLFIFLPQPMIALYLNPGDPDAPLIMQIAVGLMFWAALFQLVDALQVQGLGLLRGVQDTRVPMYFAALSYWVIGLPAAWLFAFPFGIGPAGLWIGLMIGLAVASVLMMRRFYVGLARGDWTREAPAR
ncbi:MATE family efflux transporter [Paracoccus aerodenitrificans]|uniref:MATE family efflux transporter n=1 Tax=Paracoccus aerodenitrificans TaxID=3017781 RepID=UPI0022F07CDD|nr:MATE family efflux transporter [Paracoccus aerodenitrificans]WBU62901.1 MATE family efflux transporter [Paracoccus aerodenitrificans]